MGKLLSIHVVGIYPVYPTSEVEQQFKEDWPSANVADQKLRDHFERLFLIEIVVTPTDAKLEWGDITQASQNSPRANWQSPWDERANDHAPGHWAFFLHDVNLLAPLESPVGPVPLPPPTPKPPYLDDCVYELP